MNEYIKALLTTKGWQDIEEIFNREMERATEFESVRDDLGDKAFSREIRARIIAKKALKTILSNIKTAGGELGNKKISYK